MPRISSPTTAGSTSKSAVTWQPAGREAGGVGQRAAEVPDADDADRTSSRRRRGRGRSGRSRNRGRTPSRGCRTSPTARGPCEPWRRSRRASSASRSEDTVRVAGAHEFGEDALIDRQPQHCRLGNPLRGRGRGRPPPPRPRRTRAISAMRIARRSLRRMVPRRLRGGTKPPRALPGQDEELAGGDVQPVRGRGLARPPRQDGRWSRPARRTRPAAARRTRRRSATRSRRAPASVAGLRARHARSRHAPPARCAR